MTLTQRQKALRKLLNDLSAVIGKMDVYMDSEPGTIGDACLLCKEAYRQVREDELGFVVLQIETEKYLNGIQP